MSYLDVHLLSLLRFDHFDELGGSACPHLVRADFGTAEHYGSGGDERPLPHFGIIHNDCSHSDQGIVMNFGAMDHYVMADRDIIADLDGRLLIESMEHGAILDIDTVADGDGVDIAAQHGAEPDAALIAHSDIAHEGSIIGNKAILADLGGEPPYRFKNHNLEKGCLLS